MTVITVLNLLNQLGKINIKKNFFLIRRGEIKIYHFFYLFLNDLINEIQ